jgi:hypothetical protein
MPAITFMSWNVQNFGVNGNTRSNYVPLCNLIARVARVQGVDILALLELQSGGVAHLPTLAAALNAAYGGNADWYFDWIKGSLDKNIGGNPIVGAASLDWDYDHHEGYAIFWNDERNVDFTMAGTTLPCSAGVARGQANPIPARMPANILSLVVQGRTPGKLGADNWFHPPNFDPAQPTQNWGALDFLKSNTTKMGETEMGGPRRPCYFVVQLKNRGGRNNQPANCLFPMVVMHATSNGRSRQYDTQLAGFSRQLYRADSTPVGPNRAWATVDNALIAGDFNVDGNKRDDTSYDAYRVYTASFNNGGADCEPWLDLTAKVTPQTSLELNISYGSKIAIVSNSISAYYADAIDNIFYRLGNGMATVNTGPYAAVFDLLTAVMKNGALCEAAAPGVITAFYRNIIEPLLPSYPDFDDGSGTPANLSTKRRRTQGQTQLVFEVDSLMLGDIWKWRTFVLDVMKGTFTKPRTAAEFIKKFVSDHLPVTIRINFT